MRAISPTPRFKEHDRVGPKRMSEPEHRKLSSGPVNFIMDEGGASKFPPLPGGILQLLEKGMASSSVI